MISIQSRSLTLSWMAPDTPNGNITHYELWYRRSGNESFNVISNIMDTTMMHSIDGLTPGVTYVVKLRAYTRVGPGPYVNQTVATELERKHLTYLLVKHNYVHSYMFACMHVYAYVYVCMHVLCMYDYMSVCLSVHGCVCL